MSARRISLAIMLKFTALVAMNLALLRQDLWLFGSPILFFILVALNVVLFQAGISGRPLQASHYTFLVVGTVSSIATEVLLHSEVGLAWVLEPLGRLIQRSPRLMDSPAFQMVMRLVPGVFGILPAYVAGHLAVLRVRRRGQRPVGQVRRVLAILQGAVIGLGQFFIVMTVLFSVGLDYPEPQSTRFHAQWVGMSACLILGGLIGWLASRPETHVAELDAPPEPAIR